VKPTTQALLLAATLLVACNQGDGAPHATSSRLSYIPQSWTVPAWFVDPANATGAANDGNTCTTIADPCLNFAGVTAKWGTFSPRFRQNTTITFLSPHSDDSDPVYLRPFIEHGALVVVQGALGSNQRVAAGTLSNVVHKNRPAGQLLRATLPLGAAPGQLVVHDATSSRAWVYKNAGAANDWFLSQPLGHANVSAAQVDTQPSENDGWANGDAVTLYQPVLVNLVEATPTLVDSTASGPPNNLVFDQLGVLSPTADSFAELTLNSEVYFIETSIGRITKLGMSGSDLLPAFVNVDFANDTLLGFADPYVHLQITGGQIRAPATALIVRGADIERDFIVGGLPGIGGCAMEGGGYGEVFIDGGFILLLGGATVVPGSSNPTANVIWGPGAVSVVLKTRVEYLPGANQAQSTFLQTGGLTMQGLTTACAIDVPESLAFRCGLPLTPANLDKPVVAGGFGGTALFPGGATITNGATPPPPVDGGTRDGSAPDGGDAGIAIDAGPFCTPDAGSAPAGPPVCGDGWRDPATEECDDGLGAAPSARRGCSAQCQVLDELAVAPAGADGGLANGPRSLGSGRHPIAAGDSTFAAVYVEPNTQPVALSMATFTSKGAATGAAVPFNVQSAVTQAASPVIAALPCERYAVAWSDLGGDGDELGVAVRLVDPVSAPTGPPSFANTTTAFSQFDPDIVWTGSQLVVAWVDNSNAATAPDVRLRTFDANLNPTSAEQALATSPDSEADVVLSAFSGSWAAAWRDDTNGLESIRAHTGSMDWTVGPFLPGPANDKPALAQLDATHLALVYTVGVDAADSGVASASKIQVAVLDMGSPGTATGVDVPATAASAVGLSQAEPSLVGVNGSFFVAWWTQALSGSASGEELWLKSLAWNGTNLDVSVTESPLPRWPQARIGDQRLPAMAASSLLPGGALILGWDDLGKAIASGEGNGDVVVEVAPVPLLRTSGDGGP
jgi:hypothetical protein